MIVARYIELCGQLREAEEGPDLDKLIGELDDMYRGMGEQERRAVATHFEAREPG